MIRLQRGMRAWLNEETKNLNKINFNVLVKKCKERFKLTINDARMYVMQWDHTRKKP